MLISFSAVSQTGPAGCQVQVFSDQRSGIFCLGNCIETCAAGDCCAIMSIVVGVWRDEADPAVQVVTVTLPPKRTKRCSLRQGKRSIGGEVLLWSMAGPLFLLINAKRRQVRPDLPHNFLAGIRASPVIGGYMWYLRGEFRPQTGGHHADPGGR